MTTWTDNAERFANRDREGTADQTMDIACRKAARIIRDGLRRGDQHAGLEARRVLARAERSASRVLGTATQ